MVGMAIAIRMAMISTTTISSISVKPCSCSEDGQRRPARVDHGGELAAEDDQVLVLDRQRQAAAEPGVEVLEGRHDEDEHRAHAHQHHDDYNHQVGHGRAELAPQGDLLFEGLGHLDQHQVEAPAGSR
jgi:hypothetical protein